MLFGHRPNCLFESFPLFERMALSSELALVLYPRMIWECSDLECSSNPSSCPEGLDTVDIGSISPSSDSESEEVGPQAASSDDSDQF